MRNFRVWNIYHRIQAIGPQELYLLQPVGGGLGSSLLLVILLFGVSASLWVIRRWWWQQWIMPVTEDIAWMGHCDHRNSAGVGG